MKGKITKRAVDALAPGEFIADTEVRGFIARRLPSGAITYGFQYRTAGGKRPWLSLGLHGSITADQARDLAKKRSGEVADDRDPAAERKVEQARTSNTVNAVLDEYIELDLEARGLRSVETIKGTFKRLVRPRIGDMPIYDLRRSNITRMLDAIQKNSGPVMADRCLAYLRAAFRWQEARDDDFRSPIGRRMTKTKPRERQRSRILDDQEIRDVWTALDHLDLGVDAPECYPRFIRTLLLTGLRRTEASRAHRDEVSGARWVIPAARMKGKKDHLVPVTSALEQLLNDHAGFLFSSDGGKTPFSGYSKSKVMLDDKIAELRKADGRKPMPAWVLHDLRRSARSIMSRYVAPDTAERVLAHAIDGVRGVYDLYGYEAEKLAALEALAAHIERILHPTDAVIPFKQSHRRG
jgi:integrase